MKRKGKEGRASWSERDDERYSRVKGGGKAYGGSLYMEDMITISTRKDRITDRMLETHYTACPNTSLITNPAHQSPYITTASPRCK